MTQDNVHAEESRRAKRIPPITGSIAGPLLLGNLIWTAAQAAQPPVNSNAELVSIHVDWHAHVHGAHTTVENTSTIVYPGSSSTITSVITVDMTGSAIVRYQNGAYYDITYGAVNLRHDGEQWTKDVVTYPTSPGVCSRHTKSSIVDPAAYSGFHADVRSSGVQSALLSNADPTRYRDSLRMVEALAPLSSMAFTVRWTQEWSGMCAQPSSVREAKSFGYAPETSFGTKTTPGEFGEFKADSADRSSFTLNAHFTDDYYNYFPIGINAPVDITWTGHAYRMGKCAERDGPIPEADPIVTTEDVHNDADAPDITPDGKTKLHIRVTCDGVPVEGANARARIGSRHHANGR